MIGGTPVTGVPRNQQQGESGSSLIATAPDSAIHHELRPHQVALIDQIDRAQAAGHRHIMIQLATGGGKTILGAALIHRETLNRRRSMFTVPALSLIDQTVDGFYSSGIHDVGVIQADHPLTNYARSVQVASVQTLSRRQMPSVNLVLIDEAHRWFDAYSKWLAGPWKHITVIGLSATLPERQIEPLCDGGRPSGEAVGWVFRKVQMDDATAKFSFGLLAAAHVSGTTAHRVLIDDRDADIEARRRLQVILIIAIILDPIAAVLLVAAGNRGTPG
jgi:hypothetical protein